MIRDISALELKKRMDEGEKPFVLDVREPFEREYCRLADDKHIPMNEIPQRVQELQEIKDRDIVVYCRSGQRSFNVCKFLNEQGFSKVFNLSGGVLAWSDDVDPEMPKY